MKFSTRVDCGVTSSQLFDHIGDHERSEQAIRRRGVSVHRVDPSAVPGAMMTWDLSFKWQRKMRKLRLEVTRYDRPEKLSISGQSDMFDLMLNYTVIALARSKSRVIVEFEVKPRNLRGRLFLQTAKLGKAGFQRQFERKIVDFYGLDSQQPALTPTFFGAQHGAVMTGHPESTYRN